MTVVLFGFGPFLEFDENPSDLVVKRLHGRTIAGHAVVGRTLPVDYTIEGQILSEIEAARPVLVVGFGLAAGRNKVNPEKVAVNYIYSKAKSNSGRKLEGVPIAVGQPDALFANIPVEALVSELNRQAIPASLSLSAGTQECNYSMYVTLREAKRSGFRSGFIHVPCHAEWVAKSGGQFPSLPLETILRAAECSVSYLLQNAA
jgi:pyroglutamyl-peptidase